MKREKDCPTASQSSTVSPNSSTPSLERLHDFYERFLSDHNPEVDVEAVIGEVDFELHPSIIIHRCKGYKKMAAFHFCLDRNHKTIPGYILAFKKVKQ